MKKFLFSLLVLLFPLIAQAKEPFFPSFIPPKGWLISDPTLFEDGIKIGFIQSRRKFFTPAISLSTEKVGEISLKDYLNAVRKLYKTNPRNRYKELGYLKAQCGKVHLAQIDTTNQWGDIRVLQAIILHEGYAVIHTATALKKDFIKNQNVFLDTFRSLTFSPDFLTSLSCSLRASELKNKLAVLELSWGKYCKSTGEKKENLFISDFFQKNQWKPFVEYFTKAFETQNACWQFLVIKTIKDKLLE